MEAVSSIGKSTDLVSSVALVAHLGDRVLEYGTLVFLFAQAHIVDQVGQELVFISTFLLEVVWLFLSDSMHHHEGVTRGILHARLVHLRCLGKPRVLLEHLTVGGATESGRLHAEGFKRGGTILGCTTERGF